MTAAPSSPLAGFLKPEKREEYDRLCEAAHARLVHSHLSACILWEILEILPRLEDKLLPDEQDLLFALATNAADRVVLTVVALTETKQITLNFGTLTGYLRAHCQEGALAGVDAGLKRAKLRKRRTDLVERARETRGKLIAHFNREQVLGLGADDLRLFFEDVFTLQDEAQAILDGLCSDTTSGYAPVAAIHRRMLHLLVHGFGNVLDGESKALIDRMLETGTTLPEAPWHYGRVPHAIE